MGGWVSNIASVVISTTVLMMVFFSLLVSLTLGKTHCSLSPLPGPDGPVPVMPVIEKDEERNEAKIY